MPKLIDLFVGEHTFPRRHLVLAVAHRVVEACAIVLRQPAQVERLAGTDQSLAVADLAIVVVEAFSGIARPCQYWRLPAKIFGLCSVLALFS